MNSLFLGLVTVLAADWPPAASARNQLWLFRARAAGYVANSKVSSGPKTFSLSQRRVSGPVFGL